MPRAGEKNKAWALTPIMQTILVSAFGVSPFNSQEVGVKLMNCVLIHVGPVRDSASVATATSKQGMGVTIEAMIV